MALFPPGDRGPGRREVEEEKGDYILETRGMWRLACIHKGFKIKQVKVLSYLTATQIKTLALQLLNPRRLEKQRENKQIHSLKI